MKKSVDIICVGEVVIDFIGHQMDTSMNRTKDFHRFLGGSPTNVAVNATRLGLNSVLVATCGEDGLGEYIIRKLQANNVITSFIKKISDKPTSVIFVSKSTGTPDFMPYREADSQIVPSQITDDLLKSAKIFHTTCFALSKDPARNTILESAKRAKLLGLRTSIDVNFSERIWNDREEAKLVLKQYLTTDPLVKLSVDDCYRLFAESKTEDFIFDYFHEMGASTICLTKGKEGVVLSDKKQGLFHQKAIEVPNIKDVTGAGDAFWTGFLYAQLLDKNFNDTITISQKLAGLKLQNVGRLPVDIDISAFLTVD